MAESFKKLRSKMGKQAQFSAKKKTQRLLAQMPLRELRQALRLSQERLAELLDTKQANVSRIERRADMYISTLRTFVEAMGGELDIVAKFPEGNVHISQFHRIESRGGVG